MRSVPGCSYASSNGVGRNRSVVAIRTLTGVTLQQSGPLLAKPETARATARQGS